MQELAEKHIRFRAEYSEADESAEIIVEYSGEPFDLEKTKNQLSLTLVKNAITDLRETAQDEALNNRIRLQVRS